MMELKDYLDEMGEKTPEEVKKWEREQRIRIRMEKLTEGCWQSLPFIWFLLQAYSGQWGYHLPAAFGVILALWFAGSVYIEIAERMKK